METVTLTRPVPGNPAFARLQALPWPLIALGVLSLGAFVGFLLYPTFPNYDSYYSLLWGREALHAEHLSFEAYRAPTEHPLAIAFGAVLSLLGEHGDRVMVAATFVSFVTLAAGMYRLARQAFTPLVGLVAAGLLCSRFDFPFLAARAYIDIPFLAFVVWAAALEAEQPRRGTPVFLLLMAAGLMRPEAWVMGGVYFLWVSAPAVRARPWPIPGDVIRYGALTAAAPLIWAALDWAVTGDPKFSLTHTSGLAEELGRQKTLSEVPSATWEFLRSLDKFPVLAAGVAGLGLATWLTPRRMVMPLALLLVGVGTFFMVGLAGLSVIERYLLVPSLMVMVFAAVTIGGWTMLGEGTALRRAWAAGAAAVVVYGVIFTAMHVRLSTFVNELKFRGDAHASLRKLLLDPGVQAARRCGPVSVPNHKLLPDARWILHAGEDGVIARSDPTQQRRIQRGVALYAADRTSLLRHALADPSDDPLNSVPLRGFEFVTATGYYGAYARC